MRRFPMQACCLFSGVAVATLALFLMPIIGAQADKPTAAKLKQSAKTTSDERIRSTLTTALQNYPPDAPYMATADADLQQASVTMQPSVAQQLTAVQGAATARRRGNPIASLVLGLRTDASSFDPMRTKLVHLGLRLTVLCGLIFVIAVVRSE